LYSKLILSSETGHAPSARRVKSRNAAGTQPRARRQHVRAIRQVAAEELIGAFAAEHHGGVLLRQFREEPHRQRPGIGAGLVRVIRKLLDRVLQARLRIQIEFLVVGGVLPRRQPDVFGLIERVPAKGNRKRFQPSRDSRVAA
jgi:hypothetical protein